MKRLLLTIFTLLLVGAMWTSPVFADDKKPAKGEVQVIDFTKGDVIQTEYFKPNQMSIEAVHKMKSKSFLKIRTDFIKEIVKSAEEL